MIRIRFTDDVSKRRALGYLAGRFSFKSWATGEMLVPDYALPCLAQEGISFLVEGPATYEQLIPTVRILLPRQFNDQQPTPEELIVETLLELERRFGSVSSETQIIRGLWTHQGQSYRDELVRVFMDVPDTPETRQFFQEFKERLKVRFRQIDIWMTSHPIEVI